MTDARPLRRGMTGIALALACASAVAADPARLASQAVAICADMTLDFAATQSALTALGLRAAPGAAKAAIHAVCEAHQIGGGILGDPLSQKAQARIRDAAGQCFADQNLHRDIKVIEATELATPDGGVVLALRHVGHPPGDAAAPDAVICHVATFAPYTITTADVAEKPEIELTNHLGARQLWMQTPLVRFVYHPAPGTFLDTLRPDVPMAGGAAMVVRPLPASSS